MKMGTGMKTGAAFLAVACLFCPAAATAAGGEASELQADAVEYNSKTGEMTATGHVVLKQGDGVAYAAFASYNTQTKAGRLTGGVTADREGAHLTCDVLHILSETQLLAEGNVRGTKEDKSFVGPQAEYFTDQEYIRMTAGGTITTKDGSFTADYMEGWMQEERCKGVGSAHIVSEARNFEGGGDEAEYFGQESGKLLLTGNAWAVQDNNTLKSQRLTVYLNETGEAQVSDQ